MSNVARALVVVFAASSGALGLYAFQSMRHAEKMAAERDDVSSKLATCSKGHAEEKQARESFEKTASLAAADLNASRAELEELRREKEEADKRIAVFKAATEKFRKMIDSGKLQVQLRHGRMVVKLPASVLFPSGSADLSKEGKDALAEVAHILKQFPERRFEVAGHTDNVPINTGSGATSAFKSNLQLSTARAVTVSEALTAAGMNAARLSAAGYAEHQPVANNHRDAGRQENRRIEIVLQPNLSELPPVDSEGVDAGVAQVGAPPSKK